MRDQHWIRAADPDYAELFDATAALPCQPARAEIAGYRGGADGKPGGFGRWLPFGAARGRSRVGARLGNPAFVSGRAGVRAAGQRGIRRHGPWSRLARRWGWSMGMFAMNACRIEKGFLHFGHDR